MVEPRVELSAEVAEAAWIAGRLSRFDSGVVTSGGPAGVESYARVLHAVEEPGRGGGRQVDGRRWDLLADARVETQPTFGWMRICERDPERLRDIVTRSLTSAVIELV